LKTNVSLKIYFGALTRDDNADRPDLFRFGPHKARTSRTGLFCIIYVDCNH